MWKYQKTDELYHYGVLGMKWGHRKARSVMDISTGGATRIRSANGVLNKRERNSMSRSISRRQERANLKAKKANMIKKNVNDYNKKFDSYSSKQDKNDDKWLKVQEAYKKTGKTRITRILNNAKKNKSKAVSNYNKLYNDWERTQNKLDKEWTNVKKARKKIGNNKVSRTINAIRYSK